jgi:adenine deaminase
MVIADPARDILKLVVKDRYADGPPAVAFVGGFGLKEAAIASCVAHDSHNIVAVGTDDELIARAVNLVIDHKGGISFVHRMKEQILPLPYAGIMSGDDGYIVASTYEHMDMEVKKTGSGLRAPFMTLSFMALLVIPEFKLSDRGFFDGKKFAFTSIFA